MMQLTKYSPEFQDVRWLGLARETSNGYKPALEKMMVTEKEMVCTDGKRLHRVMNTYDYEPGLYTFVKFRKTEILLEKCNEEYRYPNFQKVFNIEIAKKREGSSMEEVLAKVIRAIPEMETVNPAYISDLCSLDIPFDVYFQAGEARAIYFQNGTHDALIMPMKIK